MLYYLPSDDRADTGILSSHNYSRFSGRLLLPHHLAGKDLTVSLVSGRENPRQIKIYSRGLLSEKEKKYIIETVLPCPSAKEVT